MKRLINAKTAATVIIIVLLLLFLMNIGILSGLLPFTMVWGGNVASRSDMIMLELITIFVLILFIVITVIKLKNLEKQTKSKISNIGLWIMFIYFSFNIIGNLAAKTSTETLIFTPVSIILALFSFRLILEK